jgi:hypothetical protein
MIRNCDAQGNPLPPLRQWWDAWRLLGEMVSLSVMAIFLLAIDLTEHFMGGRHIDTVMPDFNDRMFIVKTTVSHYLKHIHMCERHLHKDKA